MRPPCHPPFITIDKNGPFPSVPAERRLVLHKGDLCNTGLVDQGLVRASERILKEHTSSEIPTEEALHTKVNN
jgi:hypothetical protein